MMMFPCCIVALQSSDKLEQTDVYDPRMGQDDIYISQYYSFKTVTLASHRELSTTANNRSLFKFEAI